MKLISEKHRWCEARSMFVIDRVVERGGETFVHTRVPKSRQDVHQKKRQYAIQENRVNYNKRWEYTNP